MTNLYSFNYAKIAFIALVLLSVNFASATSRIKVKIPEIGQVGAQSMPSIIAPVKAPFSIPAFKKPQFATRTALVTEYGAKQKTLSTHEIQSAIDAISIQGGGKVIIPSGSWLTGRISLKSNVNLEVAEGAEVYFSGNIEDYRPAVFTRNEGVEVMSLGALIYANGQTNIAITGKGKLVGPPADCPVRKQVMKADVVENFLDANKPVTQRVYEGYNDGPIFLPMFISPINCKNVYIEGVTLENTAFWNIVPVYCDGVIIRGVTVNSVGIPRGDGIDIESTRNVLIEYSTLNCGDDCFTMKAGRGDDGLRVNRPTENVVVRHCLAKKGHGGITIGSETAGMIRNVYLHDCVFDETNVGIRFKTRRPRGGGGENIILERIRMNLADGMAITADMLGAKMYVGELAERLPIRAVNKLTPLFRKVTIRDIVVDNAKQFMKITGIPESPFQNFLLENADVQCSQFIKISDARDFTFRNIDFSSKDASINLLDAGNILFDKVHFKVPGNKVIVAPQGDATKNIHFVNCIPKLPEGWHSASY